MKRLLICFTTLLLGITAAHAQQYNIHHTDKAPLLTGSADPAIWSKAEVLTDFVFPWNPEAVPATEFRALWDKDALYFRFNVKDDDIQLGDDPDKDTAVLASDRVELFFSTGKELKPYYTMEMDSAGRVFDAEANFYRQVDATWNWNSLKTHAEKTKEGYSVAGKVDLSELEKLNLLLGSDKRELMCAILRGEFSQGETGQVRKWISWVNPQTVKPDFHIPAAFGVCKLVD
ncbi:carbohydrate-binding family 9-like protein [Budvicia aquatica]|uniref:carbohydrate-binding family 9-like protein n=1 Tax=Budvicia aquatica TaxID=82979 RepID=UPI001B4800A6|nr:carbohydrate-binding family 9-like protein [Budvicia aquatica]MBP9642742.1 endoxylanase [Budvicia sp.]GKX50450.1 hypothetical protein SOASR029_07590 [Budvicia aquatica]